MARSPICGVLDKQITVIPPFYGKSWIEIWRLFPSAWVDHHDGERLRLSCDEHLHKGRLAVWCRSSTHSDRLYEHTYGRKVSPVEAADKFRQIAGIPQRHA